MLDLACGEGYNARILARKGAKVTAVDFSAKLVQLAGTEEAREKLGIDYHIVDAADLSKFPSRYFDLVTCFMLYRISRTTRERRPKWQGS